MAFAAGFLGVSKPKDAVALVIAAAGVGLVLLWPIIGAVMLATLVPMTSGLASGFPIPHIRLSELIIGGIGLTLIVFVRRQDAVPWGLLDWVLLAYGLCWAAFGAYSEVTLHEHLVLDQWGTVFGQLQFFLVYRGIRQAVRTSGERRLVVAALLFATIPVTLLALVQKTGVSAVTSFIAKITGGLTPGTGATAGALQRVTGPFGNWAALAGYLLPVLLVLVTMWFAKVEVRRRRWFLVTGILCGLALALTVEQSAIVCLIVSMLILARRYDTDGRLTRWLLLAVAAVAVAVSPVLIERLARELGGGAGTGRVSWVPNTVSFRWSVWTRQYLPAIGARPLTGYGVVLPPSVQWQYPESQYISFLVEGGVPMLLMFGGLAVAMLRGSLQAAKSSDRLERALGLATAASTVSLLVMSSMWPFLSNGGMPQMLWALMAVTVPGVVRADEPSAVLGDRRLFVLSGGLGRVRLGAGAVG